MKLWVLPVCVICVAAVYACTWCLHVLSACVPTENTRLSLSAAWTWGMELWQPHPSWVSRFSIVYIPLRETVYIAAVISNSSLLCCQVWLQNIDNLL